MKDEKDLKLLTHEELVLEVYQMAHQLSYEKQQEIKNKLENIKQ